MYYILVAIFAYILGSSSMSLYISKWKKVDIRDKGSRNLGASNAMLIFGWKYGILVGLHDIGKAAFAVILARLLFPNLEHIGIVAGVFSVLGHIYPFYLKFKGGKGFASYLGMTFALNWKLAFILLLLVVLVTWITDYIVVGTALTVLTVPAYYGISTHGWIAPAILLIATGVILYKHRMNFVKIYHGTEIGFRSANRGDHRTLK